MLFRSDVHYDDSVDDVTRILLADAQTSGGLLMAVAEEHVGDLLNRLEGSTPAAARVGHVTEGSPGRIRVSVPGGS